MIIDHNNYQIEIKNDETYSLNSVDNINTYDHVYNWSKYINDSSISTKTAIKVIINEEEIRSAILIGFCGGTTIHESSFIIKNDCILICCSDTIYSLNIPDLSCNWKQRFDQVTCFGIFKFKEDFIVHGELEVSRIDFNGNRKWSFHGKDIFLTESMDEEIVTIKENTIELIDWELDTFILDENGEVINKIVSKKEAVNSIKKNNILNNIKNIFIKRM